MPATKRYWAQFLALCLESGKNILKDRGMGCSILSNTFKINQHYIFRSLCKDEPLWSHRDCTQYHALIQLPRENRKANMQNKNCVHFFQFLNSHCTLYVQSWTVNSDFAFFVFERT